MTTRLRTSPWQLAAVAVGWLVVASFLTLGFTRTPSIIGAFISTLIAVYLGASYPLSCRVSPESVTINALLRRRTIPWSTVSGIRRTKGPWRRREVAGRMRVRPTPGAILLVLPGRRTVLMLGHVETREENAFLVETVGSSSPALADSLRLSPSNRQ